MAVGGAAKRKPWLGVVVVIAVALVASQWWAGHRQAEVGQQLVQWAVPGDLQMLSSTTCPICTQARLWFNQHGVPFDECFIETDPACRARYEATRSPGTPVIVVRGVPQVGFSPQRLADALKPRSP